MSLWRRTLTVGMGGDGAEGKVRHVRWKDVRGGDLVFSYRCSGILFLSMLLLVSLDLFGTSFHGVSFLGLSFLGLSFLGLWCLEFLSVRFLLVFPFGISFLLLSLAYIFIGIVLYHRVRAGSLVSAIHIHTILYRHALRSIKSILSTKIESLPIVDLRESLHLSDM
jgi:hypothetical protein